MRDGEHVLAACLEEAAIILAMADR